MADPARPDVPVALGVPPVVRASNFVADEVQRLTKDSDSLSAGSTVFWGIFSQKGTRAVIPDNIAAFEFQREYRISDYPLEQGSFESFNKVTLPYDIRVIMTKGGKLSERKEFLDKIDIMVASLEFYTIVTPERVFSNANLVRQDYRRDATSGVSLLTVELHAVEIRTQVSVQFVSSGSTRDSSEDFLGIGSAVDRIMGDVQAPSGANPQSNGSVQPWVPTALPSGHPDEAPAFR